MRLDLIIALASKVNISMDNDQKIVGHWVAYLALLLLVLIQFSRNDFANGAWLDYFTSAKSLHFPLTYDYISSMIFSNITWPRFLIEYFGFYIYRIPSLFLLCGFFTRLMALILLYHLSYAFIKSSFKSTLAVILIAFSDGIIGNTAQLITIYIAYYGSIFSFCLIILSIIFLKQCKYFWSGMFIGFAGLIDIFYAVAAFLALLCGLIYFSFKQKKFQFKILLYFNFGFLLILSPFILSYIHNNLNDYQTSFLPISTWYHFLIARGSNNIALGFTFWPYGPNIFAVLLWYYALKKENKMQFEESLILGLFTFFLVSICIEIIHASGVFFGDFSILFLNIEPHRAWHLLTFVLVPLLIDTSFNYQYKRTFSYKNFFVFLFTSLSFTLICVLSPYLSLLLILAALIVIAKKISAIRLPITIFYLLLFIVYILQPFKSFIMWYNIKMFYSNMVFLFYFSIICWFLYWFFTRRRKIKYCLVLMLILAPLSSLIVNSQNNIIDFSQLTHLTPKTVFRYIHSRLHLGSGQRVQISLISDFQPVNQLTITKYISPTSLGFNSRYELTQYVDTLSHFGNTSHLYGKVLSDPSYQFWTQFYTHMPCYLFEIQDRAYAFHSIAYASDYDKRLQSLYGPTHGLAWLYQNNALTFNLKLRNEFYALTVDQLKKLARENGIRYVITRKKYPTLKKIYSNNVFYVYQLSIGKKWDQTYKNRKYSNNIKVKTAKALNKLLDSNALRK